MLTPSGVKILDFGLAKALAPTSSASALTALPDEKPLTATGTLLGTVQYMAPEQLEGERRTRAPTSSPSAWCSTRWSPARRAFGGATQASLIGAILRDEPPLISRAAADRAAHSRSPGRHLSRQGAGRALADGARRRAPARGHPPGALGGGARGTAAGAPPARRDPALGPRRGRRRGGHRRSHSRLAPEGRLLARHDVVPAAAAGHDLPCLRPQRGRLRPLARRSPARLRRARCRTARPGSGSAISQRSRPIPSREAKRRSTSSGRPTAARSASSPRAG